MDLQISVHQFRYSGDYKNCVSVIEATECESNTSFNDKNVSFMALTIIKHESR